MFGIGIKNILLTESNNIWRSHKHKPVHFLAKIYVFLNTIIEYSLFWT